MKSQNETIQRHVHHGFLILITIAWIFGCLTARANETGGEPMDSTGVKPCELFSFTAKTVEGKNYVSWLVTSRSNHYYFILQRSVDGKKYSTVKIKKCLFSPPGQKLLYTFTDYKTPYSEKVYYRLKLHKIKAIDPGSQLVSLSEKNTFEVEINTIVVIEQKAGKKMVKR